MRIPEAPFPLHMFVFHSDGTVEQSNPDAGDPVNSDSNLMGAWMLAGGKIKGKVVEITADRTTHRFATRGQVSFELKVSGDTFDGVASAVFYGADGRLLRGPLHVRMTGERVLP